MSFPPFTRAAVATACHFNLASSDQDKHEEKDAGISAKTNHSERKTLVQKLQDCGVPANQTVQITGQKNVGVF